jgi:hypothetical protein
VVLARQVWWLLTYAWRYGSSERLPPRALQPVTVRRSPVGSPPPGTTNREQTSAATHDCLANAKAPIRWYGDRRDIYLA